MSLDCKARHKKQRKRISLEEKHENSYGGGEKMRMLGATEVKMSGSEKKKKKRTGPHMPFLHKKA